MPISDDQISGRITGDIHQFAETLERDGRLMGLDLGTKTIGLALSDPQRQIATPLDTLRRTKFKADAAKLVSLIAAHDVIGLVLGLPTNMDGSEGPRVQATRAFAQNISRLIDVGILLWDERLTTAAAERALLEADASRKRRAAVVDKVAATLILQGALERLRVIANEGAVC